MFGCAQSWLFSLSCVLVCFLCAIWPCLSAGYSLFVFFHEEWGLIAKIVLIEDLRCSLGPRLAGSCCASSSSSWSMLWVIEKRVLNNSESADMHNLWSSRSGTVRKLGSWSSISLDCKNLLGFCHGAAYCTSLGGYRTQSVLYSYRGNESHNSWLLSLLFSARASLMLVRMAKPSQNMEVPGRSYKTCSVLRGLPSLSSLTSVGHIFSLFEQIYRLVVVCSLYEHYHFISPCASVTFGSCVWGAFWQINETRLHAWLFISILMVIDIPLPSVGKETNPQLFFFPPRKI